MNPQTELTEIRLDGVVLPFLRGGIPVLTAWRPWLDKYRVRFYLHIDPIASTPIGFAVDRKKPGEV